MPTTRSARLKVGALAALYVLWLATWLVLGDGTYGPAAYYWDQTAPAAATGILAFVAARGRTGPYPAFLVMLGVAFLLLAASWATYQTSSASPGGVVIVQYGAGDDISNELADWLYASCVFTLLCAWSYLALERWSSRPLSSLTTVVFVAFIAGLGVIFASFYYHQYGHALNTVFGRLDAVTAGLEFAVLATGLLCMLFKEPPVVAWMLVGTVILMAGDMAYSVASVPEAIEAVWMLGQLLLLSAVLVIPQAGNDLDAPTLKESAATGRSGLSGILILVSLGAVLLSPVVWFLPVDAVWKSFFSVLFIVALVLILVWITDRFDDTVAYLRGYVQRTHRSRLVSEDWRGAQSRIVTALRSTGLGTFLDEFRESAAHLKRDVLFLGPERLFQPPRDGKAPEQPSCFIVMPFSEDWAPEVHLILSAACKARGTQPVRGDDLFTPDILQDIWQSLNTADFVIADITKRNPNVLYELGIAHTLAKRVIILSKDASDIPFDLKTRRVIEYGRNADTWRDDLARAAQNAVAEVMKELGLGAKEASGGKAGPTEKQG